MYVQLAPESRDKYKSPKFDWMAPRDTTPITEPSLFVLICCQSLARPVGPVTSVQVSADAVGAELIAIACKPVTANTIARKLLKYLRRMLAGILMNTA